MFRLFKMKTNNPAWSLLISINFAIFIITSIVIACVIGTIVPQNGSPEAYIQQYGPFVYHCLLSLDIIDLYHAWWFNMMLVFFIVNIIACTIDRLVKTRKVLFPTNPTFSLSRFQNLENSYGFRVGTAQARLLKQYRQILSRQFAFSRDQETQNGFVLFAEKRRWTRLGVHAVHGSIVFVMLGGLIGGLFGFEGFAMIPEGESVDQIRLERTGKMKALGFTVRCDDYNETYHANGSPAEFRSSITILENNRAVLSRKILVNNPLKYKGITIYQASRQVLTNQHAPAVNFSVDNIT